MKQKGRKALVYVVSSIWAACLTIYAFKALFLGYEEACHIFIDCPIEEFFGGILMGLLLVPGVAIADIVGFEKLSGGTYTFLGGMLLVWLSMLYESAGFKPTNEEIENEVSKRQKKNPGQLVSRSEVVEFLSEQKRNR